MVTLSLILLLRMKLEVDSFNILTPFVCCKWIHRFPLHCPRKRYLLAATPRHLSPTAHVKMMLSEKHSCCKAWLTSTKWYQFPGPASLECLMVGRGMGPPSLDGSATIMQIFWCKCSKSCPTFIIACDEALYVVGRLPSVVFVVISIWPEQILTNDKFVICSCFLPENVQFPVAPPSSSVSQLQKRCPRK